MPVTEGWRAPKFGRAAAQQAQAKAPGMMGGIVPTPAAPNKVATATLNTPTNLPAGGFRQPGLTEAGNTRVPGNKFPNTVPRDAPPAPARKTLWDSPRFDQHPHPPIDPAAEAMEFAAGICKDPNCGESANSKSDNAKACVFHERMARFHQARSEDDQAAAHMAASGAHQQANRSASDGGYSKRINFDRIAREHSIRANNLSGFGHGFGSDDWDAPDFGVATDPPVSEAQRKAMAAAAHGESNKDIPQSVGKEFIEADPGGKLPDKKAKDYSSAGGSEADGPQAGAGGTTSGGRKPPSGNTSGTTSKDEGNAGGGGRYQLFDRETGQSFDVDVPATVNFSEDAGVGGANASPIKAAPVKPQPLRPQPVRDAGGEGGKGLRPAIGKRPFISKTTKDDDVEQRGGANVAARPNAQGPLPKPPRANDDVPDWRPLRWENGSVEEQYAVLPKRVQTIKPVMPVASRPRLSASPRKSVHVTAAVKDVAVKRVPGQWQD